MIKAFRLSFKILFFSMLYVNSLFAQNIGVNNPTPDPSAVLDITSTDKGLLVPRVALTSTAVAAPVATPATGLLVFNTATAGAAPDNVTPGFYFWDGTKWTRFDTGNNGKDWSITGNAGTDTTINFLGTTDDEDLIFRRNNIRAGRIGISNTYFGLSAGNSSGGALNAAVGVNALRNIINGTENTAMGHNSLFNLSTGIQNVAIGSSSGISITSANFNTLVGVRSGNVISNGGANTAVGHGTLSNNANGGANVAVGFNAMKNIAGGNSNVAIGPSALASTTVSIFSNSVAVGDSALLVNTVSGNTAVGSKAGRSSSSGSRNTFIGFEAGFGNISGSGNTVLGNRALRNNVGQNNVAIGDSALFASGPGSENVAVGKGAGTNIFIGNSNTLIGNSAGRSVTAGSDNTFVGFESGRSVSGGQFNSFFGNFSGQLATGSGNVVLGHSAGFFLGSGVNNTIVGRRAGVGVTSNSYLTLIGDSTSVVDNNSVNATAIGSKARVNGSNMMVLGSVAGVGGATSNVNVGIGTTGPQERLHVVGNIRMVDGNQAVGKVMVSDVNGTGTWGNPNAGDVNAWGLTGNAGTNVNVNFIGTTDNVDVLFRRNNFNSGQIGETNTALGTLAFQAPIVNNNNTAIGALAMNSIVNGDNNTAVGFSSMSSIFGGRNNSALGLQAMQNVTNGFSNVAVGVNALFSIANGSNTVAIGDSALRVNTASGITALGSKAGASNITGLRNTFIGFNAGLNNTTAGSNTFIGHIAGRNITEGTLNVAVGDSALAVGSNGFTSMSVAVGSKAGRLATGSGNIFIGHESGLNVTTAAGNTMVGQRAGSLTISGFANTFLGNLSGLRTTGDHNTLVGYLAGGDISGSNNIAIGMSAGQSAVTPSVSLTGNNNIFIGNFSAHPQTFISNSVAIGHLSSVTTSNSIVLGAVNGVNTSTFTPNVGIGTTAPVRRFHVALNGASGGTPNGSAVAFFENNSSAFIHMMTPDANENGFLFGRATNGIGGALIYNNALLADGFQFRTGGNVTRMVLDAAGNLGVGVAAPARRLHVRLSGASGAGSNANAVGLFENNAAAFVQINTPEADESGMLFGKPSNALSGGIIFNNASLVNGFQFRAGGNITRMVLDAVGNVGIGVNAPTQRLEVAGNVNSTNGDFYGGAFNGVINMGGGIMNPLINIIADATPTPLNANGDEDLYIADVIELGGQGFKPGGGSWAAASDARLKKDVQPFSDGLDKVLAIKPVSFKYNDRFKHLDNGKTYIGVIAQEIKEVAPYTVELMPFGQVNMEDENGVERVFTPGEDFYSYDSSSLTYMLINAVKELKSMNDSQAEAIEDLKKEIENLKSNNR